MIDYLASRPGLCDVQPRPWESSWTSDERLVKTAVRHTGDTEEYQLRSLNKRKKRVALRVSERSGDVVLCSWVRHFILTVPLSTQVYKWVPANRPFPHYTSVRTNNSTRARFGWTFSYIYCIFVHPNLDSVPLFVGMRERSIVGENLTNCGGVTCHGLASRPWEVEILLAA